MTTAAAPSTSPATWHPVARSADVAEDPVGIRVLGGRWLLARLDGQLVSFVDRCPHRDVPLSTGWISCFENRMVLSCAYHGWSFAADGACIDIPFTDRSDIPDWLRLPGPAALTERYGLVWMAPVATSAAIVDVPEWNRPDAAFADVRCVVIDRPSLGDDAGGPQVVREEPTQGRLTVTLPPAVDRALFAGPTPSSDTVRVVDYEWTAPTSFVLRVGAANTAGALIVSTFVQRESGSRLRCYIHGGRAFDRDESDPRATPRHVVDEILLPSVLSVVAPHTVADRTGDPFGAALRRSFAACATEPS